METNRTTLVTSRNVSLRLAFVMVSCCPTPRGVCGQRQVRGHNRAVVYCFSAKQWQVCGHNRAVVECFSVETGTGVGSQSSLCRLLMAYWLDEWDGTLAGSRVCLSILFPFHYTHLCAYASWTRCPLRHTSSSKVAPLWRHDPWWRTGRSWRRSWSPTGWITRHQWRRATPIGGWEYASLNWPPGENSGQEGEGDGQDHIGHSPELIAPLGFWRRAVVSCCPARRRVCADRDRCRVTTGPLSCVFLWRQKTQVWSQLGRCRVFFCADKDRCGVIIGPLSCVMWRQRQVWGHNWAVVVCFPVKTETGMGSQLGRCRSVKTGVGSQ